ncbi:hypothetical protein IWQ62_000968, partial [Dispira parvispora]
IRVRRTDLTRLAQTVYPTVVENTMVLFYYFAHQMGVRSHVVIESTDQSALVALVFSPQREDQFLQDHRSVGSAMESAFFNSMQLLLNDARYTRIFGYRQTCWLVKFSICCEDISSVGIATLEEFIVEHWNSFDSTGVG